MELAGRRDHRVFVNSGTAGLLGSTACVPMSEGSATQGIRIFQAHLQGIIETDAGWVMQSLTPEARGGTECPWS
jgi:hypothetical protein